MADMYASGMTGRQIAANLSIPARTVARYLRQFGVEMRKPGPERHQALFCFDTLNRLYVEQGKSTTQIAEKLGASVSSVIQGLKRFGIERRSSGSQQGHKRLSPEARAKISQSRIGRFLGQDNPNWKGGSIPNPERSRAPAKKWSKQVRLRDGICQCCGAFNNLHAHHIKRWKDYPELRYDLSNGVALCHTCHEKAHGKGFKFRFNTQKSPRARDTQISA
jgi:DNA-binding CsgD family transcriptional regulator